MAEPIETLEAMFEEMRKEIKRFEELRNAIDRLLTGFSEQLGKIQEKQREHGEMIAAINNSLDEMRGKMAETYGMLDKQEEKMNNKIAAACDTLSKNLEEIREKQEKGMETVKALEERCSAIENDMSAAKESTKWMAEVREGLRKIISAVMS